MPCASRRMLLLSAACSLVFAIGGYEPASAQWSGHAQDGKRGPVYQRHAVGWGNKHGSFKGHFRPHQFNVPEVQSGWFQRPYPYHLDYYKMRYGGSYAPYFGNLYGPPQVVTAPPYYGPYFGNVVGGEPGGFGAAGPQPGFPSGPVFEAPIEEFGPANGATPSANGEALPGP